MLRDRTPKLVNFALKWCKVKEAWLDHVYKNFIWLYVSNEERLVATRRVLGYKYPEDMKKKDKLFVFEDTIAWDSLTTEETESWKRVAKWVSWFQITVPAIENSYKISKKMGTDIVDIKRNIMLNYLYCYCPTKEDDKKTREKKGKYVNDLTDFLIDCFEQLT